MAELFNILKITVGEDKIRARVLVNPGMPLMTSEDIEATARVYYLAPAIAKPCAWATPAVPSKIAWAIPSWHICLSTLPSRS